jgi:hypothetical protein
VPLGDVRLGRVAALFQAPSPRWRPPDRHRHHRNPCSDSAADATASDGQESQEPTEPVILVASAFEVAQTGPMLEFVSEIRQ